MWSCQLEGPQQDGLKGIHQGELLGECEQVAITPASVGCYSLPQFT